MRRVLLIGNPAAARHSLRTMRSARRTLEAEGCQVEVALTGGPGHATQLARSAVEARMDLVAVYGGDGTVMQAVAGLGRSGIPLGLIPGGTGNLLAGNLRLPRRPIPAARIVARGRPRCIDLGYVRRGDDVRFFAVACGAGYDADLMAGTGTAAKRRWGMAAYVSRVLRTAPRIAPARYEITTDDTTLQLEAATVLVANCNEIIPPLLSLGGDVSLDDGMLDVVALNATGMFQAGGVVWGLLRRRVEHRGIRRFRAREVHVSADPAQPVQLDGEVDGTTPFAAGIMPRALPVIVPV